MEPKKKFIVQCALVVGFNLVVCVLYGVCYMQEYNAFDQINGTIYSPCVEFFEITDQVKSYLYWSKVPQYPDLMMLILGFPLFKLYQDPFGISYNVAMTLLLFHKDDKFLGNINYCGHPVQEEMKNMPKRLTVAWILHLIIAILTVVAMIFNQFVKL